VGKVIQLSSQRGAAGRRATSAGGLGSISTTLRFILGVRVRTNTMVFGVDFGYNSWMGFTLNMGFTLVLFLGWCLLFLWCVPYKTIVF